MPKTPFQLYKIHDHLATLFDWIDDSEAPIYPEEITAKIKALFADQQELFEETRKSVLNFAAQAKAAREESQRLAELARKSEGRADGLKAMILQAMEMSGLKKVEFKDGGNVRIQANSAFSLEFTGEAEKLPEAFRKTTITYSPDREALLSANDMGLPLPEGIKLFKGSHLRLS